MSKHTPGPWKWDYAVSIKAEAGLVALVYSPPKHDDLGANASLIAAAPDLLAALQSIAALDDGDNAQLWDFAAEFDAARAAISKAIGGTP